MADTLHRLLEFAVEVGLVDMYGAHTDDPSMFLEKCAQILRTKGFEPPTLEEVLGEGPRAVQPTWGEASATDAAKVRSWIEATFAEPASRS